MKIYLDFDRTLFDCDKFLDDFYRLIENYEINKDVFRKCQIECKKEGFNPNNILKKVSRECIFSDQIYKDISDLIKNSASYLYDDAISFLKYLKDKKYYVIILTKGNLAYQKEKIEYANINDYYNEIIITMKHKGNLDISYSDGIFIDDNPKEIKSIMNKLPKMIIRIQRTDSKYSNDIIKNVIPTVKSLDEIIDNKLI